VSRPSKLTDEITEVLDTVFRQGQTSIASACDYVGITERTYHNWMHRGAEGNPDYVQFFQTMKKARAVAVQDYLGVIQDAAHAGHWQAAAWWLERVLPEQYGRKTTIETISRDLIASEIAKLEAQLADNDAEL
jgi:hypothetical protein